MDRPVAIDHEERTIAETSLPSVHAVFPRDRTLRLEIGEEREVKVTLLGKRGVTPHAIDGDAYELGPEALELTE
jgi:hypothetical protein